MNGENRQNKNDEIYMLKKKKGKKKGTQPLWKQNTTYTHTITTAHKPIIKPKDK